MPRMKDISDFSEAIVADGDDLGTPQSILETNVGLYHCLPSFSDVAFTFYFHFCQINNYIIIIFHLYLFI